MLAERPDRVEGGADREQTATRRPPDQRGPSSASWGVLCGDVKFLGTNVLLQSETTSILEQSELYMTRPDVWLALYGLQYEQTKHLAQAGPCPDRYKPILQNPANEWSELNLSPALGLVLKLHQSAGTVP